MKPARSATLMAAIALVTASIASLAFAHSGATGAVKARMDSMKSIANDMKAISTTLRNKQLRYGLIGAAANRIEGHSARVPTEFRQRDLSHPTEAAALIWDQFDEFTRLSRDMEAAARQLEQAALDQAKPEVIVARFKTLGDTCGACHRDYRVKN
ncbi:MAG: cytochrome c [Pseudomonadota bacterium]